MTNNPWLTKDRSETDSNRLADKVLPNGVVVSNLGLGINLYNNAIRSDVAKDIINTLEEKLNGSSPMLKWQPAMVTEADEALDSARNCVDFKMTSNSLGPKDQTNEDLYRAHELAFRSIKPCVDDYGYYWGVGINYYEAFNFVKYDGPGTHFKIHADHGPAYVTTVSVVAYLNDDYEGGEIYFPRFNLTIKPKAGDVVVFPSTYVYEHASQDMISGKKYAIVVMTDYNDRGNLRYINYRDIDPTKITY
jgi:predicted 2-oxoglutarate/Fe(II)-dependent dioxygenase YbiX